MRFLGLLQRQYLGLMMGSWSTEHDKPGPVDVTSLLVGLIVAGIVIVVAGLLIWYFCQVKWKDNLSRSRRVRRFLLLSSQNKLIKHFTRPEASCVCHSSIRARPRRSNASLIMRRLEEVSLQPVRPPASQPPLEENDPIGLPSYEEAIAKSGQHDAPPPPYPGYVRTRVLLATFTCTVLTG